MRRANRLFEYVSTGAKTLGRHTARIVSSMPAVTGIGLVLVATGLLQALSGTALGYVTALGGVAVLLGRPQRPQAHDAVAAPATNELAAGIDRRLEELKDVVWELRDSEARYRDLLDTQENVIARRDGRGRLTYVNRAFCKVFGCEPADVLGHPWQPVVLEADAGPSAPGAARQRYTQLLETASGPRWMAFEAYPIPGEAPTADASEGEREGAEFQIVGADVTEQRASQAELASARDRAQGADRAKSRFLAAMSHEIRTPMNGILGMTGLLTETELSAEQRTYLDAIGQSASTLRLLIDEILDFSKIEAGKLVLAKAPFPLDQCVQATVELLAPAAHEKGLEIAWTFDPGLPQRVVGDEARVRQILLNLIGNAVKYTDRGGVLVHVDCQTQTDRTLQVAIHVKDTGIGLSAETREGLFSEFGQGEDEIALSRGGTGLGLAISRRLALAMGGDVTVQSEPGRGAVFTARLVLAAAADAEPLLPPMSTMRATGSVLLAFDRLIERQALAANLGNIGLRVVEALDTDCDMEIADAAAASHAVRFVVIDASSDPADAERLMAHARSLAPGAEVRGFLLIDSLSRPCLERFRLAGFADYLVRPVRPMALLSRFDLVPAAVKSELVVPLDDADVGIAGRHVLLAEDNAINALLANRMLANAGCSVVHVTDGEQAVVAMHRSLQPGAVRFDIVLMDVHMPRMDGLAATAAIRAFVKNSEGLADNGALGPLPPIVALTANAFAEDRERCLAAGLDDYLPKPFNKSELLTLLARWAKRAPTHRASGNRASAAA